MTVAQGTPRLDVTREQIEEFRREQWMPTGNKPLEPWAVEENRVLTALCDYALQGVTEGTRLACEHEAAMDEFGRQEYFKRKALEAEVVAGNVVIECCYAELKKALGRDIECPAYIPDAIKELAAQVVELQKDAERYRYVRAKPAMLLHLKNSEFDAAIDEKAGL